MVDKYMTKFSIYFQHKMVIEYAQEIKLLRLLPRPIQQKSKRYLQI